MPYVAPVRALLPVPLDRLTRAPVPRHADDVHFGVALRRERDRPVARLTWRRLVLGHARAEDGDDGAWRYLPQLFKEAEAASAVDLATVAVVLFDFFFRVGFEEHHVALGVACGARFGRRHVDEVEPDVLFLLLSLGRRPEQLVFVFFFDVGP